MEQLILIVHMLIALAIIGLILLQQGKGADIGASFGAGASQTLFGSGGSGNALTRTTAILAALFFVTSFALAVFAKGASPDLDDIGIPLPAVQESRQPMVDDIPTVDDNAASPESDIPLNIPGADD